MSSRSRKSRGTEKKKDKYNVHGYLPFQMYPFIPPGYPINPSPQWPSPSLQPNFQYPWNNNPWTNQQNYAENNPQWLPNQSVKMSPKHIPDTSPDAFMVNTVRRIYNNDDGSIEIERVKVQRRSGNYDTKLCSLDYPKSIGGHLDSHSLVSMPSNNSNDDRRPPPRKNKKKNAIEESVSNPDHVHTTVLGGIPQNWYPFLPYTNQMYPFPYPYSYMWPTPSPPTTFDNLSRTDDSDSSHSRHDAPPYSPESNNSFQKLTTQGASRKDTPVSFRTTSSAAASQVTSSNTNDIGPSDSVSMRGFKRKTSLEKMIGSVRTSTISDLASDSLRSSDMERNKERTPETKHASSMDNQSDSNVDRFSFTTALSEIPTPPLRSKRQRQSCPKNRKKSNSESDVGLQDQGRSTTSPPVLSSARVSDTDLVYASKTRRIRPDIIIQPLDFSNQEPSTKSRGETSSSTTEPKKMVDESDGRQSVASTLSFHSTRQSADGQEQVDTDSTDIVLPTDTATADESTDHLESETRLPTQGEIAYKWVLQDTEDDLLGSLHKDTNEREKQIRDSWKAEVSLWRARLVVSLCNGQGLDQGDWNTFNLLVQHPLSVSSKLSLLSAQRICSLNCELGVVFLRNALLYLTSYGETLLKPEEERSAGWNTIPMDGSQLWSPVKGSVEILYVFGYRLRENGILKYRPKCAPDTSIVARMTLDILVLAEEFRLYLNGMGTNALNITNLFAPQCSSPELSLGSSNGQNSTRTEECCVSNSAQPPATKEEIPDAATTENVADNDTMNREDTTKVEIPSSKLETKLSESNESLTPVPSLDNLDKQGLEGNESTKKGVRDNPEEHIYEEITEVKSQVEALKKYDEPPPLPPKSRPLITKSENNFYPFMDLSLNSQCNSISGSTASRSKKRRAPMPPSFMSSNESQTSDDKLSSASQDKKSFTAIPVNKAKVLEPSNPFYETRTEAAGYVGKNPFYDDVDMKGKVNPTITDSKKEEISENTDISELQKDNQYSNGSIETKPQSDLCSATDEESSEPGIRPQRKKEQNNIIGKSNLSPKISLKEEIQKLNGPTEDKSSGSDSQASVVTVKNSSTVQSNIPNRQQQYLQQKQEIEVNNMSKNEARGHQCDSPVVVPSSNSDSEKKNSVVKLPNDTKEEYKDDTEEQSLVTLLKDYEGDKSVDVCLKDIKKEATLDISQKENEGEKPVVTSLKVNEGDKLVVTLLKDKVEEKPVELSSKEDEGEMPIVISSKDNEGEKLAATILKDNKKEKPVAISLKENEGEKPVEILLKDNEAEKPGVISLKDNEGEMLAVTLLKDNEEEKPLEILSKDNKGEKSVTTLKDNEEKKYVSTSPEDNEDTNLVITSPNATEGDKSLAESQKKRDGEKSAEISSKEEKPLVTSLSDNAEEKIVAKPLINNEKEMSVDKSPNDNDQENSISKPPKDNDSNKLISLPPKVNKSEKSVSKSPKDHENEKSVAKYPKKPDVIIKEIVISYDISVNGSEKRNAKENKNTDKHSAKKNHSEETAKIFSLCKKSIFDAIEFIDAEENSDSPSPQEDENPYIDLHVDSQGPFKSSMENKSKLANNLGNLDKQTTQQALIAPTLSMGTDSLPLPASTNPSATSPFGIKEPESPPTPPLGSPPRTPPITRSSEISYVEGLSMSSDCSSLSSTPVNLVDTIPIIKGQSQTSTVSSHPILPPTPPPASPPRTPPLNAKNIKLSEEFLSNRLLSNMPSENDPALESPETLHTSPPASPVEFLTKMEFSTENSPIILENKIRDQAETAPSPLTLIGNNKLEKTVEHPKYTADSDKTNKEITNNVKESIVFDSENRNPKQSKDTFEERYEIPDVLRAEINLLKMKQNLSTEELPDSKVTTHNELLLEKSPERPPRHRHLQKVPPLPPKFYKQSSPPELPPKGLLKTSAQLKSAGFNLEKVRVNGSLERKPHLSHSMSPSPLAIPSVSPQLYTAPALTRQQRRAHASNIAETGSSKTISSTQSPNSSSTEESKKSSQRFYVPTKSMSMPSSPKPSFNRLKRENKSEKDRKSWPFQLCNCLYIKDKKRDNNITIQYVME